MPLRAPQGCMAGLICDSMASPARDFTAAAASSSIRRTIAGFVIFPPARTWSTLPDSVEKGGRAFECGRLRRAPPSATDETETAPNSRRAENGALSIFSEKSRRRRGYPRRRRPSVPMTPSASRPAVAGSGTAVPWNWTSATWMEFPWPRSDLFSLKINL
jgi:hypothetical protein